MVKTFLKILWWQFLVPSSEYLLVSSATLLCKTQNILTAWMLVYYKGASTKNFCHTYGFWLSKGVGEGGGLGGSIKKGKFVTKILF